MAKKKTSPKKKPPRKRATPQSPLPTPHSLAHIVEPLRPLAVPIGELELDPQNARRHDEANLAAIAGSLRRYGQRRPIVANRLNARIEAGNGTLLAARQLGWTHLAVVFVKDDPATHHGFSIADNRTAELADWDEELLAAAIAEVQQESPDLADDLLLNDLLHNGAAEEPGDDPPAAGGEPTESAYQLIVECPGAKDRDRLAERLRKEGLKCRSVTWK
ncbi:hypothetical protein ES703_93941 [subsurface metagenome]